MSVELKHGDRSHCRNCGAPRGIWPDTPVPDHCEKCPPWICDGCGQLDSAQNPCSCWLSFDGMALADIKAIFAADGGFDLSPPRPSE